MRFCPIKTHDDNDATGIRNVKLSVIVPLYNADAMFYTSNPSLLAQTLTDLEIILVNVGSGLEGPAHECAERYTHVRVIDQPNGGASRAMPAWRRRAALCHPSQH
ncbi:MAG: hypothetical protein GPOALKHO_001079 [Sodalis sp.]|uniref:glycosyltransferase n=1 Tax=Sodalis sp. (in: enterobacteria) TaxID=1898979 RepID=UPI0038731C1B|nr:MAG: hypothetical protein GPOALKHO_001079 [Sodalis sp.]